MLDTGVFYLRFQISTVREAFAASEKNFAVYVIGVTDNLGRTRNSLTRRYRDFNILHIELSKVYPKDKLPVLPPKKLFGNLTEKITVERRLKLETFLNKIAHLEGIWNQPAMKNFLEGEMSQNKSIVAKLTSNLQF